MANKSLTDLRKAFFGTTDEEIAALENMIAQGITFATLNDTYAPLSIALRPALVEPPPVNAWVKPAASATGTSSGIPNGQARWVPLWLPPGTYDGMAWSVTSAGSAGAVHRGILYLPDADGNPNTLALDTGPVSAETATTKTVTGVVSPLVLTTTTLVWGSIVPQGSPATPATVRSIVSVSYQSIDPYPNLGTLSNSRFTNDITGAPPASITANLGTENGIYNFAVHRSA